MMARQRLIKPSFFKHHELWEAEHRAALPLRLCFAGLWTVSDRRGVFRIKARELKTDILPYDDGVDFEQVITALESGGFIQTYHVAGKRYGFIPTFTDHQSFNVNEKPSQDPGPEAAEPNDSVGTITAPSQHGVSTPSTGSSTGTGSSAGTSTAAGAGAAPAVRAAIAANDGLRANPHLAGRFNELLPQMAEQPVADWLQAGIPLPLICQTVEEVCRRYKPAPHRKQPSSFAYFDPPIREAHARAQLPPAPSAAAAPPVGRLRDMTA